MILIHKIHVDKCTIRYMTCQANYIDLSRGGSCSCGMHLTTSTWYMVHDTWCSIATDVRWSLSGKNIKLMNRSKRGITEGDDKIVPLFDLCVIEDL